MCGGWGEESRALRHAAFLAACRVSCGLWAARNACGVGCAGAWGACRALRLAAFLAAFGPLATLAGWGALGREGHAALCGLPRFLRPLGRSQRLRGWGALGREGHAALCGLPRFLRPLGRSQRLRGWGAGRWGACRVLQPVAFLAAFGPLATLAPCGRLGRGGMPRFATCRVSCGLRPLATLAGRGAGAWGHAALCSMPRFLRPSAARNACFLCFGTGSWGAAPNPGRGMIPLHPALSPCTPLFPPAPRSFPLHPTLSPLHPTLSPLLPYLTTRFLSLRKSSVTPSGGSPNVALSVLLPPSHVSCIAISLASIRQPSSTTVTTSPTS